MGAFGIGMVIGVFIGIILIIFDGIDNRDICYVMLLICLLFSGIGLIVYDATSPVEETVRVIETSDQGTYGFGNVATNGSELFTIKIVEKNPTRFGAVFRSTTEYYLLLD